ncbi:MAG: zinc carboxypeptidase [Flavobacteriaceae bacterium]|nr:zinc carboxypeptidase [Flavobacteriaceae bacterium]MBT4112388.1 zinc carboxypeptidase [Flavobacteriaceae bacterium]MBT4614242.1 zinc carboxypeptidase [Flavobacteriaceae bacterium]MBT5246695.1 zinc carboxypeptidase [Flavobacteriaceae bacterium]MBT5649880.1 zinc carboxypeptidase [Flavobacteriaceae bacterium]
MRYLFLFAICCFFNLQSQNSSVDLNYYFSNQENTFDESIPTPESIIGHQVGEWHITHDKLVQYMKELARSSDRVTIQNRGLTYEDRPLILLTITSKNNHSNIEKIKESHMALSNSNDINNFNNLPLVVYQGFSIHGNEPSGSNASLLLAYYLAASKSSFIDDLLEKTVILLDPSFNPDGLQRFAYWANTNKNYNLNPDPNDREYNEAWPGGRTNHYWFDMNRDWLPVQLPESRARIKTYNEWLPNILTDHHEMGTNATFFFQPGIPSRTHPLTPILNQELTQKIADFHVEELNEIGSLYYSKESFDDFYYGKGSTFPDINGGIGILFEQASSRGHIQKSANGILTFPFTIKNQLTAAISTLKAGIALKESLLEYQYNFYKNSREEALKSKNKGIIFGDSKDRAKTIHLAEILKRHEIDFYNLKKDINYKGNYYKKDYAFIIPKNQKKSKLINAMFESRTKFKDSLFYDVSAWTLPLAFNLDYDMNADMNNAGDKNLEFLTNTGGVTKKTNYAYLMEWHEYYTPRVLNKILNNNMIAKVALKRFNIDNKAFDYGTILIPVFNKEIDSTYNFLNKLAKENSITIHGVNTGLADGIDLGSSHFKRISKKKIALLVGEGFSAYDCGEIWHLFDTRYDIKLTKLDVRNFSSANISDYSTIIMPSSRGLNSKNSDKIKKWVENGGTLIAYKNSLKWVEKNNLVEYNFKETERTAKNISFEQKSNYFGSQAIGGAIFEVNIDRTHPINFGYKNKSISIFRNSTLFIEADKDSYNNPIIYSEKPLLSGYISEENLNNLKSTVPLKINKLNKGKIISITDNTNFRAFWYGTNKLLINAIYFSEQF